MMNKQIFFFGTKSLSSGVFHEFFFSFNTLRVGFLDLSSEREAGRGTVGVPPVRNVGGRLCGVCDSKHANNMRIREQTVCFFGPIATI